MKKSFIGCFAFLFIFIVSASAQNNKSKTYSLFLDNSGSLRTKLQTVIDGGKSIVRKIGKDDSISLFCFEAAPPKAETAKIKLVTDWHQRDKLFESIDNLFVIPGSTTLYDAIFQMAEKVNSQAENSNEKINSEKILILVTDGDDRKSRIESEDLIKFLKEGNIKVYVGGILQEEGGYLFPSRNPREKSKKFLEKITKEAGGKVIFHQSQEPIQSAVEKVFAEILKS